ncbi:MAG: redox-sensing transcriptional repressor Rex [Ruminococcus sp.]
MSINNKAGGQISMPVIRRLPKYYRSLSMLEKNGVETVSSRSLSEIMNITASQVRQDLNCFGGFGQQGCGYVVKTLKKKVEELLGVDSKKRVIVYGIGNLGRAILCHFDFEKFGFVACGLFDKNEALIGEEIKGLRIRDDKTVEDFLKDNPVDTAILCIPTTSAESVVDRLYASGVRCFLNFSHFNIKSKYPDCLVENVHLSESIMTLSYLIENKNKNGE